jgi:hypothetical protein
MNPINPMSVITQVVNNAPTVTSSTTTPAS